MTVWFLQYSSTPGLRVLGVVEQDIHHIWNKKPLFAAVSIRSVFFSDSLFCSGWLGSSSSFLVTGSLLAFSLSLLLSTSFWLYLPQNGLILQNYVTFCNTNLFFTFQLIHTKWKRIQCWKMSQTKLKPFWGRYSQDEDERRSESTQQLTHTIPNQKTDWG